jgi:hypothetical protein
MKPFFLRTNLLQHSRSSKLCGIMAAEQLRNVKLFKAGLFMILEKVPDARSDLPHALEDAMGG